MNLVALQVPGNSTPLLPEGGGSSVFAVLVVLALFAALVWLMKANGLRGWSKRLRSPATIEGTLPLGERRALLVVSIEGRRLLLGVTPAHVSLVTELAARAPFEETLTAHVEGPRGAP